MMRMELFVVISLFFLGSALGSFFGVLVSRYSPDAPLFSKKLLGRSRCDSCRRKLSSSDLFPILSFLIFRGRCRTCGARIPFRFFLMEIMSGGIVAGVPLFLSHFYVIPFSRFFLGEAFWWQYTLIALWTLAILFLMVLVFIDIEHYLIPDEFHVLFLVLGLGMSMILSTFHSDLFSFRESFLQNYALVFSPTSNIFFNHILGGLIGGLFFLLLFLGSRGRGIGFGDVKLALSGGFLLGWPESGLSIILSFLIGGIISSILFFSKLKTMKDRVPFAPFFVTGYLVTIFFGHTLVDWYFSIFGL